MKKLYGALCVALLSSGAMAQGKSLEIFSWWAGDEGPALEALIKLYNQKYPTVKVQNATVTGGAGVNAKVVLKTRMLSGDPPDTFQVHAGQEVMASWVSAGRMEDLTLFMRENDFDKVFPQGLLSMIRNRQGVWVVPVNVHRSNVLWFNPAKLREWGVVPPKTWEAFFKTCNQLKAKGIVPLSVGEAWTQQHLWESVALGVLGPDDYEDLWKRKLSFTDPKAIKVWEAYGKVLECTNTSTSNLTWQQATDMVVQGKAAFNIMGDWAAGYMTTTLKLKPGEGFGWIPSPDTGGVFMMLADTFGLPKGAKNRAEVLNWLKVVGSREGQDIFNPLKGSISPRKDSDMRKYNLYLQSSHKDFNSNKIVGSMVHGAVAKETFMSQFGTAMDVFMTNKNAVAAANTAEALAVQIGLGK